MAAFLGLWRGIVVDSDFRAGRPVLAVAVAVAVEEPPGHDQHARSGFTTWERLKADSLRAHGAEPERAAQPATHRRGRGGHGRRVPRQAQHRAPGPHGGPAPDPDPRHDRGPTAPTEAGPVPGVP
ncbi:hypothetical protein ABZX95_40750 [Streptomyces sp. NPDC004232]|uniref:LmrA/YxaF family transcription factor n=1 Tax=Streptomyces sp. NPDC004232 TaxID=3154454 RepID=UPI0033A1164D